MGAAGTRSLRPTHGLAQGSRGLDPFADLCTLSVYTNGVAVKHVGIKQARETLPELVHRAEVGEEIVITRQGRPVARLVGAPRQPRSLPALREFRRSLGAAGTPAVTLVREERDAR
jgi:prevent-host-death family protein